MQSFVPEQHIYLKRFSLAEQSGNGLFDKTLEEYISETVIHFFVVEYKLGKVTFYEFASGMKHSSLTNFGFITSVFVKLNEAEVRSKFWST